MEKDKGYFIAQKMPDGNPGLPISNTDGAIMVFDDWTKADSVRDALQEEHGKLSVFQVSISLEGEVVSQ